MAMDRVTESLASLGPHIPHHLFVSADFLRSEFRGLWKHLKLDRIEPDERGMLLLCSPMVVEALVSRRNDWRDLYRHLCLLLDKHYYEDSEVTRPTIRAHIVAERLNDPLEDRIDLLTWGNTTREEWLRELREECDARVVPFDD